MKEDWAKWNGRHGSTRITGCDVTSCEMDSEVFMWQTPNLHWIKFCSHLVFCVQLLSCVFLCAVASSWFWHVWDSTSSAHTFCLLSIVKILSWLSDATQVHTSKSGPFPNWQTLHSTWNAVVVQWDQIAGAAFEAPRVNGNDPLTALKVNFVVCRWLTNTCLYFSSGTLYCHHISHLQLLHHQQLCIFFF